MTVKCIAIFLASSGLRKSEVLYLKKSEINTELRCIIPNCHSGETKQTGISFYNEEAEKILQEYLKKIEISKNKLDRLFVIGHEDSWEFGKEPEKNLKFT